MYSSLMNALLLTYIVGTGGHGVASILEEPETQYILTGSTALFNCRTFSDEVYWYINDNLLSEILWSRFMEIRPEFNLTKHTGLDSHSYDLHMSIFGNNETNGTTIFCQIYDNSQTNTPERSHIATLYVFDTFLPPPQPIISVQAMTEASVQLTIVTPYQWADYEESMYNISLKASQVDVLSFPLSIRNSTFGISLDELNAFPIQPCSSYTLEAIAVSAVFGLSEPSLVEFVSPKKEMPEFHKINATVYFNSSGTPFLTLYAQVNHTCSLLNYKFSILLRQLSNNLSISIGSKDLGPSGVIYETMILGLESDMLYLAQVAVDYTVYTIIRKNFSSDTLMFETSFNQEAICVTTEGKMALRTDNINVAVALGILCAILLGLLLTTAFFILCVCVLKRNPNCRKTRQPSDAMITNPIYSGPVYETVPQGYNPLCSSASTTPDSSPTTPLNGNIHYTANPTSRTDIIDLVRRNTLPTQPNDRIVSPLAGNSYRSSSLSGNLTEKHPHHERNKLHLTLSLRRNKEADQNGTEKSGTKKRESGSGPLSEEDANYTVMSPAVSRTFGSSLNGGWGEMNPEVTSKYKE